MKRLSILPIAFALIWLTACASLERNTERTLGTTAYAVEAGMNGWGDYVRAGKATPEQEASVRQMLGQYQRAMGVAETAVRAYYKKTVTDNLPPTASEKQQLKQGVRALSAISGDLIMFITEIIQKRK